MQGKMSIFEYSSRQPVLLLHFIESNWQNILISHMSMVVVNYEHRTLNTIHIKPKWKSFTWTQANGFTISFRLKIRYMVDYLISYESFAATVLCCTLSDSRLNDVVVYFRTLFFSFSLFVGPSYFSYSTRLKYLIFAMMRSRKSTR